MPLSHFYFLKKRGKEASFSPSGKKKEEEGDVQNISVTLSQLEEGGIDAALPLLLLEKREKKGKRGERKFASFFNLSLSQKKEKGKGRRTRTRRPFAYSSKKKKKKRGEERCR